MRYVISTNAHTYIGTGDVSYSSNLSTLFLYSSIGIKRKAWNTGIPGLLNQNPFSILGRYRVLGILGSLDGPLLLELARLKGRHVGQQWALLQLLFECNSWAVQLIWVFCDNVIQKPGRDGGAGGQTGALVRSWTTSNEKTKARRNRSRKGLSIEIYFTISTIVSKAHHQASQGIKEEE